MCDSEVLVDSNKLDAIRKKIKECEVMSLKIKAVNFINFQSYETVKNNYELGEIYVVENVGYTIITKKVEEFIDFVLIMSVNNTFKEHFQDAYKILNIKQGVYLDLYTGKEYKEKLKVPAYDPSFFKAVGDKDLIIKGTVFNPKFKP